MRPEKPNKNLFRFGMIGGFLVLAAGLAGIQQLEINYWFKLALSLLLGGAAVGLYALLHKQQDKK